MQLFETFGVIAAVLVILAVFIVGLIINATGIRIASLWLGLGKIPLRKALNCSLMSSLAPAALSFQNVFQVTLAREMLQSQSRDSMTFDYALMNAIAPNLLSSIGLLCVIATIISCVAPTRDAESPVVSKLSFRESVALAVMSMVMTLLMCGLLGSIAFAVIRLFID
jgi:hypothetical protein